MLIRSSQMQKVRTVGCHLHKMSRRGRAEDTEQDHHGGLGLGTQGEATWDSVLKLGCDDGCLAVNLLKHSHTRKMNEFCAT